eukprot:scaffold537838_cov34-Prasinocladus_malaysianus.AAC.1
MVSTLGRNACLSHTIQRCADGILMSTESIAFVAPNRHHLLTLSPWLYHRITCLFILKPLWKAVCGRHYCPTTAGQPLYYCPTAEYVMERIDEAAVWNLTSRPRGRETKCIIALGGWRRVDRADDLL